MKSLAHLSPNLVQPLIMWVAINMLKLNAFSLNFSFIYKFGFFLDSSFYLDKPPKDNIFTRFVYVLVFFFLSRKYPLTLLLKHLCYELKLNAGLILAHLVIDFVLGYHVLVLSMFPSK